MLNFHFYAYHLPIIMRMPGIQAVTTPSKIWRIGVNLPSFLPRISSTKAVPHKIAHKYQIPAQRMSGVMERSSSPKKPSIVPKTMALIATNVENHATAFKKVLKKVGIKL